MQSSAVALNTKLAEMLLEPCIVTWRAMDDYMDFYGHLDWIFYWIFYWNFHWNFIGTFNETFIGTFGTFIGTFIGTLLDFSLEHLLELLLEHFYWISMQLDGNFTLTV